MWPLEPSWNSIWTVVCRKASGALLELLELDLDRHLASGTLLELLEFDLDS